MREANENKRKLKLIDLNTKEELYFAQIKNEHLIGRIKTSIYQLLDGHIYYNNNIIKIRYDLMRQSKTFKDHEVFDFYDEIFDLAKGEIVTTMFPFVSINSHKLFYIT